MLLASTHSNFSTRLRIFITYIWRRGNEYKYLPKGQQIFVAFMLVSMFASAVGCDAYMHTRRHIKMGTQL